MASKIKEGVSDSEVAIVGESYIFSLLTWNIDGLDNKDILERTTAVVKDIKTLKPWRYNLYPGNCTHDVGYFGESA